MHLSPEGNIRSLSFTINDHLVYVVQFIKSKIFNQDGFALDKIWSKHLEHLWHYYQYLVGVVLTNIIITKKVKNQVISFIYYNVGYISYDSEACAFVFLVGVEGKSAEKKPEVFSRDDIQTIIKSVLYILQKDWKVRAKPALEIYQSNQERSFCLTLN